MAANVDRIVRREIEAQAVIPLIKAFGEKIGLEAALAVLRENNEKAAHEYGQQVAREMGVNDMAALAKEVATWGEGGVMDEEVLELTAKTYAFNVTKCCYADVYRELGVDEFGVCLSCCRDEPFVRGFNPNIKLIRTQTIMEGAAYCDFKYVWEEDQA